MKILKLAAFATSLAIASLCAANESTDNRCNEGAYSVLHEGSASSVQHCKDGKWDLDGALGEAFYTVEIKANSAGGHPHPITLINLIGREREPIPFGMTQEHSYRSTVTEEGSVDAKYETGLTGMARVIETEAGLELEVLLTVAKLRDLKQLPGGIEAPNVEHHLLRERRLLPKHGGRLQLSAGDAVFDILVAPKSESSTS